jgi:hypothetical protein
LIFTCCHPALPLEARVALTLRTRHPPPERDPSPKVTFCSWGVGKEADTRYTRACRASSAGPSAGVRIAPQASEPRNSGCTRIAASSSPGSSSR